MIKINKILIPVIIALIGVVGLYFVPVKAQAESNIPLCEITRSLKIGDTGEDVMCLQKYLNWSGHTVAQSGFGSPGSESQYFGQLTADAVKRWQNANASRVLTPLGIAVGTGYWGNSSFNYYVELVRTALGV